jgi:hypothetical protein
MIGSRFGISRSIHSEGLLGLGFRVGCAMVRYTEM